jgi:hypothetical protein
MASSELPAPSPVGTKQLHLLLWSNSLVGVKEGHILHLRFFFLRRARSLH